MVSCIFHSKWERRSRLNQHRFLKTRTGVVFTLSGLLIFYHLSKVFDLYWGVDVGVNSTLIYVQSVVRLTIALSLSFVLLRYKVALWGMWLSITTLTLTRYMLLWETESAMEVELAVYLSYLRGFMFPTVITLLFPSPAVRKQVDRQPQE